MKKKVVRKLTLNRETLHGLENVHGGLRKTDEFVSVTLCGDGCGSGSGTYTYGNCPDTNLACSNTCQTGGACTL